MLTYYFNSTTDLALRHEMAYAFQALGEPLPPNLAHANAEWSAYRSTPLLRQPFVSSNDGADNHLPPRRGSDEFDAELAAIYMIPLDPSGKVITLPDFPSTSVLPDAAGASAAMANGSDIRTTHLADGTPVRLLTYRLSHEGSTMLLQVGRPLTDQRRILTSMLAGLLALGGACTILLTGASWWMAGRSLRPAQNAWDRQQAFVANASHELRAPLTLMRASADVALRELPSQDDGQRELWTDVLQECDHMARLVEDLLLLSRLDSGRLVMKSQPITIAAILEDLHRQAGRVASERGLSLVVKPEQGTALADPERLRQVLLILIDNAMRHTSAGGHIHLGGQLVGRMVHLVVTDTGEGIPPEHLARIFDRFYVIDSARRSSGSGLGLSIAKALVEAQHGNIRINSRVGVGTTVEVILPRAPA